MKFNFWTFVIVASIAFVSCGDNKSDNSDSTSSEEAILETEQAQSFVKDSFTYYNGHQKKVDVIIDQYFGFVFKADGQNLQWELDPKIGDNLVYVSEIYEPELDKPETKSDGKQYFTFQAAKKGHTKLKFKSKISNETKTIHIHVK